MAAGGDTVDCFDLTLPTQELFHPRNRIRRLAHRLLGDFLKLFSRHWVQVVLPLFEIGEKFRILHSRVERFAEDLDSFGRSAGRAQHRPAQSACRENHGSETPARVWSFISIHQLPDRWCFRELYISLASGLNYVAHKAILAPGVIRLPRQERFDGKSAAMNLAPLDGKIDLRSAGVACDKIEFCPEGFGKKLRQVVRRIRCSLGPAPRCLLG